MQEARISSLQERLKILKKKYPDYGYFFDFYGSVIAACMGFSQKPEIEPVELKEDLIKLKLDDGFHLIENEAFQIDKDHAQNLFFTLCKALTENSKEIKAKVESIESFFREHPDKLEEIFREFLREEDIKAVENTYFDMGLLQFLVLYSLKPSLKENGEKLKEKLKDINWTKGYCPVCGHYPSMSSLREHGKRYVKCSFCAHEWSIARILCPFCENKDHEQLRYIKADGEDGYRVYLCDKCKKYLKTVDERIIDNVVDLALEDVATLHLDILAEREGYHKK